MFFSKLEQVVAGRNNYIYRTIGTLAKLMTVMEEVARMTRRGRKKPRRKRKRL